MIPFRYGQVVQGPDFCGRKDLIAQLAELIASGQNVVLTGERRMGKTSLVRTVVERRNLRCLYADFWMVKSVDDVCKRLIRGIIEMEQDESWYMKALKMFAHLKPTLSIDPISMMPEISFGVSTQDLKLESITEILAMVKKTASKKSVVVFDEFQGLTGLGNSERILALMRSDIQFHQGISYVFSGSIRHKMDSIFNDPDAAFYKSATPITVGPLPYREFSSFLLKKFASGKRVVSEEIMRRIFELTFDVPGDIQQLCEAAWTVSEFDSIITPDILNKALLLIFAHEQDSYIGKYEQLKKNQSQYLLAVARLGGKSPYSGEMLRASGLSPSFVNRAIEKLKASNILFESQGELRFFNPFFRLWLLHSGAVL